MKKIILPKGFLANGIHCGLKKRKKDLSLFYSETPFKVAGVFTKNKAKAAPVVLDQNKLRTNKFFKAVIVNSGNANCMTGRQGMADAMKMAEDTAKALGIKAKEVLVSSTGIIGQRMPVDKISKGIDVVAAGLDKNGLLSAAEGIMTTDQFIKSSTKTFKIGSKLVRITGVAKGAGMIHPDMATMLSYIMTDADISGKALKKALKEVLKVSFNAITVDGDMSTNDTVLLMANGESENATIDDTGSYYDIFKKNLEKVTVDLAKMVVKDGEGANKFIEVKVSGAKNAVQAGKIACAIGSSVLVKCAVLGGDPNWGRIASSAGASGADIDMEKLSIKLDGVTFFSNGKVQKNIDRKKSRIFKGKEVLIEVDAGIGKATSVIYSCDISKEYINFNSYYTT